MELGLNIPATKFNWTDKMDQFLKANQKGRTSNQLLNKINNFLV